MERILKKRLLKSVTDANCSCKDPFYKPWYSSKFKRIDEVVNYWKTNYNDLRTKSVLFKDSFYNSTLPAEVIEAIAANLAILEISDCFKTTRRKTMELGRMR